MAILPALYLVVKAPLPITSRFPSISPGNCDVFDLYSALSFQSSPRTPLKMEARPEHNRLRHLHLPAAMQVLSEALPAPDKAQAFLLLFPLLAMPEVPSERSENLTHSDLVPKRSPHQKTESQSSYQHVVARPETRD